MQILSSAKDYMFDLYDERDEWIKAQLGDPDADENTVGWAEYESKLFEHRFNQQRTNLSGFQATQV